MLQLKLPISYRFPIIINSQFSIIHSQFSIINCQLINTLHRKMSFSKKNITTVLLVKEKSVFLQAF